MELTFETLFATLAAGLTLNGLGAAAGSSFWYEQLARLRQARQVVDTGHAIEGTGHGDRQWYCCKTGQRYAQ